LVNGAGLKLRSLEVRGFESLPPHFPFPSPWEAESAFQKESQSARLMVNLLTDSRHGYAVVRIESPPRRQLTSTVGPLLVFLLFVLSTVTPILPASVPEPLSEEQVVLPSSHEEPMKLYKIFIDKKNSTVGGDGYLTTKVPDSGQRNASALDDSIEFSSREMLTDLTLKGRASSNNGEWEVPLHIFLRATASSEQQEATYTFTLRIVDENGNSETLSTAQEQHGMCSQFLGCEGWNYEIVKLRWIGDRSKVIPAGGQITLTVTAEASCEGAGGPFSSCDAEIAWGDPEQSDDFTLMEFWSNAVADSQVKVLMPGALWTDPEVLEWYPHALPDDRQMSLRVDVRDAFGREDIQQVSIRMRAPDGTYPVDHIFANAELTMDQGGLVGELLWSYQAGIEAGAYELSLSIIDTQGPGEFVITHDDITIHRYGIDVRSPEDRTIEYVAPGETTIIEMVIRHTGESGSIDVELDVLTSLDPSWLVTFDRPDGYTLSGGGVELLAVLTMEAPSELGTTPDRIDIAARAFNSSEEEVAFLIYQIRLEKMDVFAPAMLSLWDSDHENQIYNSSRAEEFDSSAPQFVDAFGPPTSFYIDIFNTGFDADSYRFTVSQMPLGTTVFFIDNSTQMVMEIDPNDGLYHTDSIDRHTVMTVVMKVSPSSVEDDPDSGLVIISFFSEGNSTLASKVEFTPYRTNGLKGEVVFDCDGAGNGLGHIASNGCLNDDGDEHIDIRMRVKITQTSGSPDALKEWKIVNPADYDRNAEVEEGRYTLWEYMITDSDGNPLPMIQLTLDDSIEFELEVHLTSQVLSGNHTIYLRIEETTGGDDPERFFDMPFSIEVGAGDPSLKIVQVSANQPIGPEGTANYTMLLKNEGNTDMRVLLSAKAPSDWSATAEDPTTGSRMVTVLAFDEVTFRLRVIAPSTARHGDIHNIEIEGEPYTMDGQSFLDSHNTQKSVDIRVEIDEPFSRLTNEIINMRTETKLLIAGFVILAVAAIAGRRRATDEWAEDDDYEDDDEEEEFDIPEPVDESVDDDDMVELADDEVDDDDIEILDD
jgi:hypothetical protein